MDLRRLTSEAPGNRGHQPDQQTLGRKSRDGHCDKQQGDQGEVMTIMATAKNTQTCAICGQDAIPDDIFGGLRHVMNSFDWQHKAVLVTASGLAQKLGDLAEELASLPIDDLPKVLQALSRVNAHLADVVAAAPAHYPHVTKRAADAIYSAVGSLELALNEELNPPVDDA